MTDRGNEIATLSERKLAKTAEYWIARSVPGNDKENLRGV
jgi:hypothetical protein